MPEACPPPEQIRFISSSDIHFYFYTSATWQKTLIAPLGDVSFLNNSA